VVCAPSPGYVAEQGSLANLPVLTKSERDILIEAAKALNEDMPAVVEKPVPAIAGDRPGDEFNRRGDVRALLREHGWALVKPAPSCATARRR
jgi:hypothetical protein